MEIDTSKKRVFYRSATKYSLYLLILLFVEIIFLNVIYKKFNEGKLFEVSGIFLIATSIIFLIFISGYIYRFSNFNNKPLLELTPEGIYYERSFMPWHAVRGIRTPISAHFVAPFGGYMYALLDVDELHHLPPSALGDTSREPRKVFNKRDLCIMLSGYKLSRKEVECMIRAYAKAHGAPATKDWD